MFVLILSHKIPIQLCNDLVHLCLGEWFMEGMRVPGSAALGGEELQRSPLAGGRQEDGEDDGLEDRADQRRGEQGQDGEEDGDGDQEEDESHS